MWRHNHTGPTEWTWYSKLKGGARGNGFRLDHAFGTPSLCPRITVLTLPACEREGGISNRSIVSLETD